jgi:hypothetical protein
MTEPVDAAAILSVLEELRIEQEQQRDLLLRLLGQTAPGGVQLSPVTREALARLARDELQSIPSLVEKIVADHLRERGYLAKGSA